MKVIVASLPKCYTKTLQKCLRILGYIVYDFDENFAYLAEEWFHIMKNGPTVEIFKKMYAKVDATTDIPACHYWETLHEAFPDAKIILTVRKSADDWLRSWDFQMRAVEHNFHMQLATHITPTGRRFLTWERLIGRVFLDCPPQGFTEMLHQSDPEIKKRKYREHNQSVLLKAPKDKLLVMNIKDGWKPLCEFLGKDIPRVPFPHANKGSTQVLEGDATQMLQKRLDKELYIVLAAIIFIVSLLLYFAILK